METMDILISLLVVVVAVIIWLKCQHRTATRQPIRYVRDTSRPGGQEDVVPEAGDVSTRLALNEDHKIRAVVGNIRPGIYNPNPPPPRPPEA